MKSLLLCCWEMSEPIEALFHVNLATVSNKYLGLCLFSSKSFEKLADLAVFKAFLYSIIFSLHEMRNTSSFVFFQLITLITLRAMLPLYRQHSNNNNFLIPHLFYHS